MHLKMTSAKWPQFGLGHNVLICYVSVGIKDEPESKNAMFTEPND